MTDSGMQRKLRAIFSADVKGYSKLMGEDDEHTIKTITEYRRIITELIEAHHGRVVDAPGDNILAEFSGALNAVNSAVQIQQTLEIENAKLPDNRRMVFRIGINLGDIVHKKDRIYGDGVNVAARIESLADPGGICISRGVFDQVKNKLRQGFEYLGEHTAKNIAEPVRIYRLLLAPGDEGKVLGEPKRRKTPINMAAIIAMVGLLVFGVGLLWVFYPRLTGSRSDPGQKSDPYSTEERSIAVLPFKNMSNDPTQDYLCDGIADQIINAIAKIPYIKVISRNSSFAFKGQAVKVQQIAADLGVRYILEGSLQRDDNHIRINTQLVDSLSGQNLWTDRYDGNFSDIFAVQDEISMNVMVALQVKLTAGESARLAAETADIRAYEKFLKGVEQYQRSTAENLLVARQLFLEAIDLDPRFTTAYLMLGWIHLDDVWRGRTKTPAESIAKAEFMAQKAISIHGVTVNENALLAGVHVLKRDYDRALAYGEKAVEQCPNCASAQQLLGVALRYKGQYDSAILRIKKAIQLEPVKNITFLGNLGWCYLYSGQYEQAIATWDDILPRSPDNLYAYLGLTAAYWWSGAEDQAREAARQVLKTNPHFSIGYYEKLALLEDQEVREKLFHAWRQAGLK